LNWGCLTDNSGERLNGIQEVSGSIPLISTKMGKTDKKARFGNKTSFFISVNYPPQISISKPFLRTPS